jgi:hypothetical protein
MRNELAASAHYEDGWFYGYAPREELDFVSDEQHLVRYVNSKNVVGRFRDHEVIDIPASRAAKKSIYKKAIVLESRSLRTAQGAGSDIAGHAIRFDDAHVAASVAAIERFPEAWADYQAKRKTPVSDEEREALADVATLPVPAPKPKRERRKKPAENVVPLKANG